MSSLSVPVIFGGGDESLQLFRILDEIKKDLARIEIETYGSEFTQVVVLLCFSGDFYNYNESQVGKTRIELKNRRASVDYYFGAVPIAESKRTIGAAIIDSLQTLSNASLKKRISFDWAGLIKDVQELLEQHDY